MNVTEDIIADLFPLYIGNECSAATRALVAEYFQQHPEVERRLRHIMNAAIATQREAGKVPDPMQSLRAVRRIQRRQTLLMAAAICFSFVPLSVHINFTTGQVRWLVLESPAAAMVYAMLAVVTWAAYAIVLKRSSAL